MRTRTKWLSALAIILVVGLLTASTTINGARAILGLLDASGATHTLPFKVVASTGALPATCTAGEAAIVTGATLGQQIYQCSSGNTWTQQLNSGTATGGGISVYSAVGLTVTANTYYFPIGGGGTPSTTETNVDVDSPSAATATNLYVQLSVALGMGNTGVFTMRKNASSQSITCTISGAVTTSCSDTTHSFNVSQGDLLTVQLVTTGTIIVTPNVMFAFQFGNITATGTVNSGTINQCAYYAATGSAVSGQSCASGALTLIEQHSASTSASLDFTTCITSTYDEYRIDLVHLLPATNGDTIRWRASTDGGMNYDSGNNYSWARWGFDSGGGSTAGGAGVAFTQIGGVGISSTASNGGASGSLFLVPTSGGTLRAQIAGQIVNFSAALTGEVAIGSYNSTTSVNAFQFLFSTGNITSGTVRCYGLAK